VPVRDEPSAAEIHAEQTQGRDAPEAISARDESLLDTYWKLIELGGQAVVTEGQRREPHLILHREGSRVSAHGGCNRLAGSYRLNQERLTFGKLIATRMACEPGFRQEARFTAALAACAAWRVQGPFLELLDEAGKSLARFEVRHL
jgi:heat shock protein HslJ